MPLSDQAILDCISAHPGARREEIRRSLAPELSQATIWRHLKVLVETGKLEVTGRGPGTGYVLAGVSVVRAHLKTPYNQRKPVAYNREFLDRYIPNKTFYLSQEDRKHLHAVGLPNLPPLPAGTYPRRILEKLLVDLSWASSRMEGNTYSILDTEKLIRFGEEALGKDRKEAVMILNHKEAIRYMVENIDRMILGRRDILNIHALLSSGLLVDPAMSGRLRRTPVEISHSSYRPIDNPYEIEEEFDFLLKKAAAIRDPFEQAFFILVHIPYLQPFEDVNKRTSRIASNIPLLKANFAPMSFVTMNDRDYVDGLLGVYELNNISLFRESFIEAYQTADHYKTLRAEVEMPAKSALVYRDFVRQAVRRCVLEWKAFRPANIKEMAVKAKIPQADLQDVIDYVGQEFRGLHEGNVIRYGVEPEDIKRLKRG